MLCIGLVYIRIALWDARTYRFARIGCVGDTPLTLELCLRYSQTGRVTFT